METSYEFTSQQRKISMSEHQEEAAIRQMRRVVKEQKHQRFEADLEVQNDRNKL